AILAGAKEVIAKVGSYESNMLEIAEHAQVSRATVYNHFSDKDEMFLTLVESEVERLAALAAKAATPGDALYVMSREISIDSALARMAQTDPTDIAKLVTVTDHKIWNQIRHSLGKLFGDGNSGLILHWLISQIAAPLSEVDSRHQANQLAVAISH
ncbi:MAG: helix-turn-helix domain-containing protein, partial [Actinomycetes bacterium]